MIHSSNTIKKRLTKLVSLLNVSKAAISRGFKSPSAFFKIFNTIVLFPVYFFNSKQRSLEIKKFNINPKFEVAQALWNLLDTKGIKEIYKLSLPKIAFRKKFLLKKEEIEITRDYISSLIESDNSDINISELNQLNNDSQLSDKHFKDSSNITDPLLKEYIKDIEKGKF